MSWLFSVSVDPEAAESVSLSLQGHNANFCSFEDWHKIIAAPTGETACEQEDQLECVLQR